MGGSVSQYPLSLRHKVFTINRYTTDAKHFSIYIGNCIIDDNGDTALLVACRRGCGEFALDLLDIHGEDCCPWACSVDGDTALILACKARMEDVALKLLDLECRKYHLDKNGKSFIDYCCSLDLHKVLAKHDKFWWEGARRKRIKKNSKKVTKYNCYICRGNFEQEYCLTCGHRNMCLGCILKIQHLSGSCPICRKPIEKVIKLYA